MHLPTTTVTLVSAGLAIERIVADATDQAAVWADIDRRYDYGNNGDTLIARRGFIDILEETVPPERRTQTIALAESSIPADAYLALGC